MKFYAKMLLPEQTFGNKNGKDVDNYADGWYTTIVMKFINA